ncbi:hypothetical protein AAG570_004782 [Ranatra chinensis]|uniref:Uncharacterized protein n=1 Tax=Ranatra chinensis TaxID=642074 RepID=A0ABD0Y1Y0_9HEMI
MASKRLNMSYKNEKQETPEIEYYMPDVVSYTAGLVLILPLVIVVYRGRPCSVIPGLVAVVVMLAADLSPVLYRSWQIIVTLVRRHLFISQLTQLSSRLWVVTSKPPLTMAARTLGRSIDNGVESDAGRSGPLRPAYATHTLLSVYTFLPLVLNR